jgi:hypothetical protein
MLLQDDANMRLGARRRLDRDQIRPGSIRHSDLPRAADADRPAANNLQCKPADGKLIPVKAVSPTKAGNYAYDLGIRGMSDHGQ